MAHAAPRLSHPCSRPARSRKRPLRPHPPSVLLTQAHDLPFLPVNVHLVRIDPVAGDGQGCFQSWFCRLQFLPGFELPGSRGGGSGEWTGPAPKCEPDTRMARFSAPGELRGFAVPRFPQL